MSWALAASARAAAADPDTSWANAKMQRMRYGLQWLLPQAQVHWQRAAQAGSSRLPDLQA